MNRIIKFRAWHKDRMIPWVENLEDGTGGVRMYFSQMIIDKEIELMQFTGLADKNGVEIYEGDIIRYGWEGVPNHWTKPVTFEIGQFGVNWNPYEMMKHKPLSEIILIDRGNRINPNFEVIGNVWENSELLK